MLLCTGNSLGDPKGLVHARGGGHLPQGPLLPKAPTGQKAEGATVSHHMYYLRADGDLYPEICGLGGMRLPLYGNWHAHPQRRNPSLWVRRGTCRNGKRPLGHGSMCTTLPTQFGATYPSKDPSTVEELAESFSFSEIQKRNHADQILPGPLRHC